MNLLAIDIGGSAVNYAVSDENGTLRNPGAFPTPDQLELFLTQLEELLSHLSCEGIAISSPGTVNCTTGEVTGISAVPWLHHHPLKELFLERFHLPASFENDANCAALSELWKGNASDVKDCYVVVLGTGIGGAMIKDGKLHHGAHNPAGEIGLLHCCVEGDTPQVWSHYSTIHTVRRAEREAGLVEGTLDGRALFDEASHNPIYQTHVNRFYEALASGVLDIQQLYDPERILIGGGISSRRELIPEVYQRIEHMTASHPGVFLIPDLRICQFGKEANLIGAIAHFLEERL